MCGGEVEFIKARRICRVPNFAHVLEVTHVANHVHTYQIVTQKSHPVARFVTNKHFFFFDV